MGPTLRHADLYPSCCREVSVGCCVTMVTRLSISTCSRDRVRKLMPPVKLTHGTPSDETVCEVGLAQHLRLEVSSNILAGWNVRLWSNKAKVAIPRAHRVGLPKIADAEGSIGLRGSLST